MITHREAVRAIILTPGRELLLLKIRLPDVMEAFWIAPGGGLEPGESVEDGLKRELREEVGLDEFTLGPLVWRRQHTFNWKGERICQRERYYVIHAERFQPRMSDRTESQVVEEVRWWPIEDLAYSHERLTPLSLAEIMVRYVSQGPPKEPLDPEELVD